MNRNTPRKELDLNALINAIQAHIIGYGRYPSDRDLASTLNWPIGRVKARMIQLAELGIGRKTTILPSKQVIEYDTLMSDIQKLKAAGVETSIIAEWCSLALFSLDSLETG